MVEGIGVVECGMMRSLREGGSVCVCVCGREEGGGVESDKGNRKGMERKRGMFVAGKVKSERGF